MTDEDKRLAEKAAIIVNEATDIMAANGIPLDIASQAFMVQATTTAVIAGISDDYIIEAARMSLVTAHKQAEAVRQLPTH